MSLASFRTDNSPAAGPGDVLVSGWNACITIVIDIAYIVGSIGVARMTSLISVASAISNIGGSIRKT